jgi:hypothetical protein
MEAKARHKLTRNQLGGEEAARRSADYEAAGYEQLATRSSPIPHTAPEPSEREQRAAAHLWLRAAHYEPRSPVVVRTESEVEDARQVRPTECSDPTITTKPPRQAASIRTGPDRSGISSSSYPAHAASTVCPPMQPALFANPRLDKRRQAVEQEFERFRAEAQLRKEREQVCAISEGYIPRMVQLALVV